MHSVPTLFSLCSHSVRTLFPLCSHSVSTLFATLFSQHMTARVVRVSGAGRALAERVEPALVDVDELAGLQAGRESGEREGQNLKNSEF